MVDRASASLSQEPCRVVADGGGSRTVLRKHDIQFVKETIAPHSSPLLSVYVDVDPGKADNARRAWLVRVRNTVKGLRVPDGIAEKVIQALEFERPEARTYVLFAAQD